MPRTCFLHRAPFAESLAGLSCLLLVLSSPRLGPLRPLLRFAPLTYAVYLSHLLFLKVGESTLDHFQVLISPAGDLILYVTAVLGSGGLAWVILRRPQLRWLS